MNNPGLYVIMTNPRIGYRAFMEICIEEGLPIVQLRDKHLPDAELLTLAWELSEIRAGSDTKLVINDRTDIAWLARADGVHLGQDDLPMIEAARLWPGHHLFGLSTHSPEQAATALSLKPDYIGFGPVFPTPTKAKPDPAVGLTYVREITEKAPCPVICIGGIFPENVETILDAGAKNVCMVRYFCDSDSPRARIAEMRNFIREKTL